MVINIELFMLPFVMVLFSVIMGGDVIGGALVRSAIATKLHVNVKGPQINSIRTQHIPGRNLKNITF